MKKILLLLFTASICLLGCKKSETSPITTESKPFKIELTSDWLATTANFAFIKSDNQEEITLSTKVTDKNGSVLNKDCKLTLNGNEFNSSSFKTLTPGKYIFQASYGNLKSNEYTVTALDLVERYASIESSGINSVNSLGLVTVAIKYKNISNKKLKYINFSVSCYNRVNDLIKDVINGSSSIPCQAIGFFDPNQSNTTYWQVGYFTGAASIQVKIQSVTLEDGTMVYGD